MIRKRLLATLLALATATLGAQGAIADAPLPGIIDEFCEDVEQASREADTELDAALDDVAECFEELDDCQSGIREDDPVACLAEFVSCNNRSREDVQQACETFEKELEDSFEDALRAARRESPGVERRFQRWLANQGQRCLGDAGEVAERCQAIPED